MTLRKTVNVFRLVPKYCTSKGQLRYTFKTKYLTINFLLLNIILEQWVEYFLIE